jgi:peptide/nickel transport system substrate-binding protein
MREEANFWTQRRVSRRAALRGAGVGVAGLAGAALIGCGDDDDEEEAAAAQATTAPGATQAAGAATAAPTQAAAATPEGPQSGGTYIYARTGDPPTLDPYGNLSYLTKGVAVHAYSRLMLRISKPGIPGAATLPGPDLAESIEVSDDAMTWVVKLKPNAKFINVAPVNGRKLTTEDVLFSWGRQTAEETANRDTVAFVTSLDAVDDRTLRFQLEAPSATFQDVLADANLLWVMPVESDGGFDPGQEMIGSGPWISTKFQPDVTMDWKRNPDWHLGPERPYLDEVVSPIIPEYANRLAQFQAGNLTTGDVLSDDVLGLKAESKYAHWTWITGDPGSTLNAMMFSDINDTSKPWSDERVRQAVSMSLDRAAKMDFEYNVEAFKAAGLNPSEAWHNIIPVGQARFWLDPTSADQGPSAKFFQYDVAEAKKLMAAAGQEDGFDIPFIYNTNRYGGRFGDVQEVNLAFLEAIGIMGKVEIQDYSSIYITSTFRGEFEGVMSMWQTPFPEAGSYPKRNFNVEDPLNSSRVDDPEIWDLTIRQDRELDFEKRRELMFEIQRLSDAKMYYIPMTYGGGTGFSLAQPWIKNVGVYRTQGYGGAAETRPYRWIDQEEFKKYS